MLIAFTNTA